MTAKIEALENSVRVVAEPWVESAYYDEAEEWVELLWHETSPFRRHFDRLDLTNVLELAVGHGRNAAISRKRADNLILMDVVEENLEKCRIRFAGFDNISIIKNNGYDYYPVMDSSLTSIYCFDAMVHFSPDLVESYLLDTARVLKKGGLALFHHSNYLAPLDQHYGLNPHARNHMSKELFAEFSQNAGLKVVESTAMAWCEVNDLDCLTLVEKP